MTTIAVLLSRVFAHLLDSSPLKDWAVTKSPSRIATWIKSLAALFNIDRLVSLDLAWWPFEVMKSLEYRFSGKRVLVFEWGSGASTIWMAKRGYQVISVEHDERWAQEVKLKSQELTIPFESIVKPPMAIKSPQIGSQKKGFKKLNFYDYVAEIHKYGLFDLIVIDGRAREHCLVAARTHLNKDGIILFDNSNRKRYRDEIEKGMNEIQIKGITPASPLPTQSSILSFK
jgi:hypothetical protein